MSQTQQLELFPTAQLKKSSVALRTFTIELFKVVREMTVKVQYNHQLYTLPLLMVEVVVVWT